MSEASMKFFITERYSQYSTSVILQDSYKITFTANKMNGELNLKYFS